jgi:hypothetical protein
MVTAAKSALLGAAMGGLIALTGAANALEPAQDEELAYAGTGRVLAIVRSVVGRRYLAWFKKDMRFDRHLRTPVERLAARPAKCYWKAFC